VVVPPAAVEIPNVTIPVTELPLLAVPVPLFGGMLVGVYLIPREFVQVVNLAVALPVICPGVALAVGVK
jgi:hypothetical protein